MDTSMLGKQIAEILNLQLGDTYELLTCKENPYYLLVKRIPEGMRDVPKWYEDKRSEDAYPMAAQERRVGDRSDSRSKPSRVCKLGNHLYVNPCLAG